MPKTPDILTGTMLVIAGVEGWGFIFSDSIRELILQNPVLIPVGIAIAIIGITRYVRNNNQIDPLESLPNDVSLRRGKKIPKH